MNLLRLYLILLLFNLFNYSRADEGMWLPILLKDTKYEEMVKKGLKLPAEAIYSINNSSLKDAVALFGGGCSCELVSDKGLIFTNHHCGYGTIQEHSSLDNDLLTNGFWARQLSEELPAKNLSVSFLVRMEDVTAKVLLKVKDNMKESERTKLINEAITDIVNNAVKDTHYEASVKALYYGNQYFLYVTETYKDIRLVGAPPSAIGKFGGDTDNWMWPRHTGDFSIFRIYTDKDNKPAAYSKDNKPYQPKKFLNISAKGVKEGDFTMVYGYPFYTYEYIPSYALRLITETDNRIKIDIRTKKLDLITQAMNNDRQVRIQYSAKQAGLANGWKKWIGQNYGLKLNDALTRKINFEKEFNNWALSNPYYKSKYAAVLTEYDKYYNKQKIINEWENYFIEAFWLNELINFSAKFVNLNKESKADDINKYTKQSLDFYKNFNPALDRKLFIEMTRLFVSNIPENKYPPLFSELFVKKYKKNINNYMKGVYDKSLFADSTILFKILKSKKSKDYEKISKDILCRLANDARDYYIANYQTKKIPITAKIDSLNRLYMAGLMEMQKNKIFYPDANATLRVAFGKVEAYKPKDAVNYKYYTTLDGIMEKDNPEIYDYAVPSQLKELYKNKDYGIYAVNGTIPVCFIASNHTSGGNSGSPVLDGEGNLIGLNFDRNWEGTMSDILYDPSICRNICLDIRYCLFIIDKYAGAKNIIDELTIIR